MTEEIYEFVTIDRQDGPFTVPGEIVKICDNDPHSKDKFVALIKISEDVTEPTPESGKEVDFTTIDGIGATVATRIKAEGYRTPNDLQDIEPEELADQIKGLGVGRAEQLLEEVQ